MPRTPAIIAACALAVLAAVLGACAGAHPPGPPTLALLTFAVAAFSGPLR